MKVRLLSLIILIGLGFESGCSRTISRGTTRVGNFNISICTVHQYDDVILSVGITPMNGPTSYYCLEFWTSAQLPVTQVEAFASPENDVIWFVATIDKKTIRASYVVASNEFVVTEGGLTDGGKVLPGKTPTDELDMEGPVLVSNVTANARLVLSLRVDH